MGRLIPRSGYATTALATGAAASAMLWLTVAAGPGLTRLGIDLSPQSELSFSHIVRIDLAEIEVRRSAPKAPAQVADDSGVLGTDAPEAAPGSSALIGPANTGTETRPTAPASPGTLDFTQADLKSIDFELGVGERLIEKKPAIYGGKTYQIGIRIDSGGKVSANFDDLAKVFGQERVKLLSCCVDRSGYAEFADVRAAGISVAYDPTADRIVLE
jgi:hypothetical protein